MTRLRSLFVDLSLRKTIALALIIGLALPVGVSTWMTLSERRAALLERLVRDHERVVEVLALGMRTPLWELRPEAGASVIEAIMLDERVTAVEVSSSPRTPFLQVDAPERRRGETLTRESAVTFSGEEIGRVRVAMDTGRVEALITAQWYDVLAIGLFQFATGMLVILTLLRYKVLRPMRRLMAQADALAGGALDSPLRWRRNDELGVLGRSVEAMRQSLRTLVSDLEGRNRTLAQREAELASQTRLLRTILDNMTDGITLVDDRLRLVAWNDRVAEILNLPPARLRQGVPVEELAAFDLDRAGHPPQEREALLQSVRGSFPADRPYAFEIELVGGRCVQVRRRPLADGSFVSTYTDITERVTAQRAAESSRSLLEAVMDAAPAMIHVKDRDLRYRMVNRQFLDFWGIERAGFLGRSAGEVFPESLSDRVEARDRRVLEAGAPLPFEDLTHDAGPGGARTVWSTKVPLLDEDGRVTHIVTVEVDVSKRIEAERERQRWAQLLHDAIESIPNGFAVYDASRRLVVCNAGFAALYGESPEALVGFGAIDIHRRALQLFRSVDGQPPGDPGELDEDLYWSAGGARKEPLEIQLKDGRWLLVSRHPTSEGGMVLVRTDITNRKRMEQALYQSEKLSALGSLLAGVAHELNNPLSVVVGRAIMLEDTFGDSPAGKSIGKIRAAAERCARIVKTFLAMARQQETTRVPVSPAQVVESALELTAYQLREDGVEVVLNLDPELPEIQADPDQLIQVFTNLIVNARQAMASVAGPKRLTVTSGYDRGANAVRLAVADTGPGVPEALRSRIFEPFFTTKTVGQGIGLGLSLSHNIVRAHGGTISVEPAPGGGSVFTVILPLGAGDQLTLPEAGRDEAAAGQSGHILIVDDALDVAEMLGDILSGVGHRIETAESGRAALRKLAVADFDLIFCDLRMPDLDGPGLYAELEERRPELAARMIFITGDSLSEGAERFLETCGRPYIEKPFVPDEIRRLTAAMLRSTGTDATAPEFENSPR